MAPFAFFGLAFLSGLTVCGLAGSAMELVCGRRLSFAEPFVSRRHVLRSLASSAAAGPYMLLNDAVATWRAGRISAIVLGTCVALALAWLLTAGMLTIDLASRAAALLS